MRACAITAALLLVASTCAHNVEARLAPRVVPASRVSAQRRAVHRLRGGADEALPEPELEPSADEAAAQDAPLELNAAASPSCWSAVSKLIDALKSLFSPTYEYAKADTDILGDGKKMSGFAADDESWRTQRKKLNQVDLSPATRKRVLRDLRRLKQDESLGLTIDDCECLTDWVVKLVGAKGTVYEDEVYRLRVRFPPEYPLQPPEVTFMRPAPVHEHIYSDGKICLNILYSDWKPEMDVRSMSLSLLSMLSSAKKKSRPPDNDSTVVMSQGQKPSKMQWEFHDDNC